MKAPVTISLVTYNGEKDIRQCLDSLRAQSVQADEIILVDNASTDQTVSIAKQCMPRLHIIENAENVGFGRAHNQAISLARNPWVLVINQDLTLEENAIEMLLMKTQEAHIGVVGPLLLRETGENARIDTAGLARYAYYKVVDAYAGQKFSETRLASAQVWGISAACALYRKTALEKIAHLRPDRAYPEYFDESFFMYKEDVDLAGRLNQAGYSAWLEVSAKGNHRRTGQAESSLIEVRSHRASRAEYVTLNSYRNHLFFLVKQVPLRALPLVIGYEMMKLLYLLLFERKTLQVIPQTLKEMPTMFKRRYV